MKEKYKLLEKYKNLIMDRLASPIPAKHKHRPAQFMQYLRNELRIVSSQMSAIDDVKRG